jgi:hypothetical protein
MSISSVKKPRGRPPKKKTLEQEAQEFRESKVVEEPPMSARVYLAGQALAGLLAANRGVYVSFDDIKRQAYEWADKMLQD